jgi:hypothetical protein
MEEFDEPPIMDEGFNEPVNMSAAGEGLLKLQLDTQQLLKEFEMKCLRGMIREWNLQKKRYEWVDPSPDGIKLINDLGIREVIGRLSGYVNLSTKLSYFTDEEIYKNMFYFDLSLTELIAKRSTLWELDIESAKAIKDACVELVMSIMFSARKGFFSINLKSQYSRQEVSRSDENADAKKKRSFMGIKLGSN